MVDVHEDNPLVLPLYCQGSLLFWYNRFLNVQNQTGVPMADNPPRLLEGYGANPPRPKWTSSNGEPARLVVQFVINYEEGGEIVF